MTQELGPIDIADNPELRRLAEQVKASGRPRTLVVGDDEPVAVLTPAPRTKRKTRVRPDGVQSLRNLVGLGADRDGATDVSSNKYKYLVEAYLPKKEV